MGEENKTIREYSEKKKLINRLNRIEGQIRGIKRMIEDDAYCNDILIQSSAVLSALNSFNRILIENHLRHCISNNLKKGNDEIIDEFVITLQKLIK